MKITRYDLFTDKKGVDVRFAVVSDLHSRRFDKVIDALNRLSPDAILLPGDIVEIAADYMNERNRAGLEFLRQACEIAPCYYCYGNHEIYYSHAKGGKTKRPQKELSEKYKDLILSYGVNIINDSCEKYGAQSGEVYIGGLVCGRDMDPLLDEKDPDLNFLNDFEGKVGFKILLCHYPHYFERYLKNRDIDLVLSGHAHGGQWRIFGRGVYAPHQGLFPKYTSGIHCGRHVISRGAVNNLRLIPRFFNPCEVLDIRIVSK